MSKVTFSILTALLLTPLTALKAADEPASKPATLQKGGRFASENMVFPAESSPAWSSASAKGC